MRIFYDNYIFVQESNRNSGGGAVLGLNAFADLQVDEFMPGSNNFDEKNYELERSSVEN